MRKIVWVLLLLFAFAIPWEYSLDLGSPLGNIARIAGLLLILAAVPAVLQAGRVRVPGPLQWLVLAFYLWICCSCFWTIEPVATLENMRAYFQELIVVWLIWEFADSPRDLRALLRAYVAGSWVLAALTIASLGSAEAIAAGQIRFVAAGQDPNDAARFLDLGLPLAALLLNSESRWPGRLLALGYLPIGLVAVLITASRGGFLAAMVALAGCALLLLRNNARIVIAGALVLTVAAVALWISIPHATFERLATIPAQLQSGDLNQRWNIWSAGWQAFQKAPWIGTGAGSFVSAAGLNPLDTAHNTALSILVDGGLCTFFLAVGIVVLAARAVLQTDGGVRLALLTVLLVLTTASLVATVEESRTTWFLLGIMALAGRLAIEDPERLGACFRADPDRLEPDMFIEPVV